MLIPGFKYKIYSTQIPSIDYYVGTFMYSVIPTLSYNSDYNDDDDDDFFNVPLPPVFFFKNVKIYYVDGTMRIVEPNKDFFLEENEINDYVNLTKLPQTKSYPNIYKYNRRL